MYGQEEHVEMLTCAIDQALSPLWELAADGRMSRQNLCFEDWLRKRMPSGVPPLSEEKIHHHGSLAIVRILETTLPKNS
jgi:hypothetical protein